MNAKHKIECGTYSTGCVLYDSIPCRIIATKIEIQVNCTSITVEALKRILALHENAFSSTNDEVVLQKERIPSSQSVKGDYSVSQEIGYK